MASKGHQGPWQLNPVFFRRPLEIRAYMCNFQKNHKNLMVKLTLNEQSDSARIDTIARFCRAAAKRAGSGHAFGLSESAVLRYI